jgi:ribosome recycling factor
VRRDGMDHLKKLEKDGDFSEDQRKKNETLVQTSTDKFVKLIDETLKSKEEEIMQV